MSKALEKVVVALDYDDPQSAYKIVEQLGDRIDRYKIGPQLFTHAGLDAIRFLQAHRKRVFLDLKLYDTPQVVARSIERFAGLGVEFATVHCLGGRTMLEAAGSACRGSTLRLLGVTLLTSQGAPDSYNWGWTETESGMVQRLAALGMESRLAGVLCSPQELEMLRPKTVPGFLLVTPGIRLPGKEVFQDDQRRTSSPVEAIDRGADLLIVGRPLTQSPEPHRVLDELFAS
ncbi:orotidine-5'-phosphate decarboxylase [bacterium]|nr:orotidine-5'-phosphate decarboxylase [bacterium]